MRRLHFFFFIAFVGVAGCALPAFASSPFDTATGALPAFPVESLSIDRLQFGIAEPKVLPGDALHFLKRLDEQVRKSFRVTDLGRAKTLFAVLNRKATELRALVRRIEGVYREEGSSIPRAIERYRRDLLEFRALFAKLKERTDEPKVAAFLKNAERRLEPHKQLFAAFQLMFLRGEAAEAVQEINETLRALSPSIAEELIKRLREGGFGQTQQPLPSEGQTIDTFLKLLEEAQKRAREQAKEVKPETKAEPLRQFSRNFFDLTKPVTVFPFDEITRAEQRKWYEKDFELNHNANIVQYSAANEQKNCQCFGTVTCDGRNVTGTRNLENGIYECRTFSCALGLFQCTQAFLPLLPGR